MMVDIINEVKLAINENKLAIVAATLIFFIPLILGFVFEFSLNTLLNPIVDDLTNKIQTGVLQLTFKDIFFNNIVIVFRMFIFGLLFCFSALILAFNGLFTGYFIGASHNIAHSLVLIIPHGIFEFPSCILACASGFVLFKFVYNLIRTFISKKGLKLIDRFVSAYDDNFRIILQSLILLAVSSILMVIAGIVEVYVTLPLGNFLMSVLG